MGETSSRIGAPIPAVGCRARRMANAGPKTGVCFQAVIVLLSGRTFDAPHPPLSEFGRIFS